MTVPELSLLMPTRNRASDLRRGIKNALSQIGVRLELVISDNASSDETEAICRESAAIDPRIRFFRQKKTLGLYEHHNFCLEQSRGKYLGFFHDHDTHNPDFSLRCIGLMKRNPAVGLVGADWRMEDGNGKYLGQRRFRVPQAEEGLSYITRTIRSGRSSVAIPGALMQRAAVGTHRLGGAKGFGDFPLWFRIAEDWKIGHLREILWTMRQSSDAQSCTTILQMTKDYLQNIRSYLDGLRQRRPSWANWIQRRNEDTRRFVFWSLMYEWLLQASSKSTKGSKATLFVLYGYRLNSQQKQELDKLLIANAPPSLRGVTRTLLSFGENSAAAKILSYMIKYPNFFRNILNLN